MNSTKEFAKEGIIFDAKPDAIPYNYRISYKVSVICLLMHICCGRKGCSLVKMHMIANALANMRLKEALLKFIDSNTQYNLIIRFDPALNRALEYAIADEMIIQQVNGTYKLLEKGKKLIKEIVSDKDVLKLEKSIMAQIALNLTEEKIKQISERWNYQDVANQ